jgi:hypothetical protein
MADFTDAEKERLMEYIRQWSAGALIPMWHGRRAVLRGDVLRQLLKWGIVGLAVANDGAPEIRYVSDHNFNIWRDVDTGLLAVTVLAALPEQFDLAQFQRASAWNGVDNDNKHLVLRRFLDDNLVVHTGFDWYKKL